MSDNTKIEWADATVNAVNGCSVLSPGCTNCYAMKLAGTRMRNHPTREGLTDQTKAGPVWNGTVRLHEPALLQPLKWQRPRRIFWNAHGDLFHDAVPDEWIDRVFAVCAMTPQHTHMMLTKRSGRMREYFERLPQRQRDLFCDAGLDFVNFPLPNVWLGVSVEDQQRADERIPDLLGTPAAVRFLSCEPLLGPVDLTRIRRFPAGKADREFINAVAGRIWTDQSNLPNPDPRWAYPGMPFSGGERGVDWVIVGGESGAKARPMHPDWARSLRDQCANAGVPFHFKQWGEWTACSGPDGFWPHNKPTACRLMLDGERHPRGWPMQRVGKRSAGRLLDGVEHNGVPA
jgi:protein gp37